MPGRVTQVFRNAHAQCQVDCQLQASCASDGAMCQIFQMHPCEVSIDNLPDEWQVNQQRVNTAILPCKHTFHVSALALHFVLTDMRCPVCRCGPECRADVSSLPKAYQKAFDTQKKAIKANDERNEWLYDVLNNVEIHVAPLESDFSLVVDISQANQSRWIVQSPVRNVHEDSDEPLQMYRTQRSFLRSFNAGVQDFMQRVPCPTPDVTISFALVHPVFALTRTVRSACIPFAEFMRPRSEPCAWPIEFDDNGETRTAGAIVISQDHNMRQLGIFFDRHLIIGLCIASIHEQLQTMLQQQSSS